jgi:hypothetical protein
MQPNDRSQIVTILYREVMRAQRAVQETKDAASQSRQAAQSELENAVKRYTDFTLDGHIPQNIGIGSASHC